jgi:hypothetical protein
MRLAQSSVAYGSNDHSWATGQELNASVTLDLSLFPTGTSAGQFGSGSTDSSEVHIPAGTNLAIVTATGYAGPYDSTASDGRQLVSCGLLYNDVEGSAAAGRRYDSQAVVRDGIVYTDRLPYAVGTGVGKVDAATQTALKLIDWRVRGTI